MSNQRPLVSVEWLAQHLFDENLGIVDGSWHLPTEKRDPYQEYLAGHIPGAVFFDIDPSAHRVICRIWCLQLRCLPSRQVRWACRKIKLLWCMTAKVYFPPHEYGGCSGCLVLPT